MRWTDYLLLALFIGILCGLDAVSGRPMTLHEARLPQTSREMMQTGNWLVPTSGGRPWLERPPLPHWIMMAVAYATDTRCDREWSARIAPGLMAMIIVLLCARIGATLFSRGIGVASGLILSTMFEFYRYATLSEDDIFLAAVVVAAMALFVQIEFAKSPAKNLRINPVGIRSLAVIAFFVLVGLTNLAKGPLVGAAVLLGTIGVFILLQKDWIAVRRYLWLWGIAAAVVIGASWHVWIQHKFPEYWKNLHYDFNDTEEFDQNIFYYPKSLLGLTLPWSPMALIGLAITWRGMWREKDRSLRFLWCWAIVPIVVLSIPHRKHHHYLVPSLVPWAILAAIGARALAQFFFRDSEFKRKPMFGMVVFGIPIAILLQIPIYRKWIPGPFVMSEMLALLWLICVWIFYQGLWKKREACLLASVVLGVGLVYSWGQRYWPNADIRDTQFLRQVDATVPGDKLLAVNAAVGPLDFFRLQFYLRSDALLLHNLTYLRSDQIHSGDIYIVTRLKDADDLKGYGTVEQVLQSVHSRDEDKNSEGKRFTLYHVVFNSDLKRYPPPAVSVMQAMQREAGPFCGLAEGK